jgi:deoxyribose-phosphate aldolase
MNPPNTRIYNHLDITSLGTLDSIDSIGKFCDHILRFLDQGFIPAAVCVFPNHIKSVSNKLSGTQIKKVAVSGSFPFSQSFMEVKKLETKMALDHGAEEIDVVVNWGHLAMRNYAAVSEEIIELKEICGNKLLKVILETSFFKDPKELKKVALLVINSGADFIKTSSGKEGSVATLNETSILCDLIQENYLESGKKTGIKISGGIRDKKTAINYWKLVENKLGKNFISPTHFRIGASSLSQELVHCND